MNRETSFDPATFALGFAFGLTLTAFIANHDVTIDTASFEKIKNLCPEDTLSFVTLSEQDWEPLDTPTSFSITCQSDGITRKALYKDLNL